MVNHRVTVSTLDKVWHAGIPAIEIFCARQHFDYRDKAQIRELGHWFRETELRVLSLHSPMYSDDVWGRTGPRSVVSITDTEKLHRMASVDEIKRTLEVAETVPYTYLVQHLGMAGEEYDDRKIEAAFTALEEINVFAAQRGVEVLLENIPNALSSAERLLMFLTQTHLDMHFCFDVGHAHMMEGIRPAFNLMAARIRSTHVHDNDGVNDLHLAPTLAPGGTIDWAETMRLLKSRGEEQFPLLLELKDASAFSNPLEAAATAFQNLEKLSEQQHQ
jgi:sugar phosphate isomerase/epimerase